MRLFSYISMATLAGIFIEPIAPFLLAFTTKLLQREIETSDYALLIASPTSLRIVLDFFGYTQPPWLRLLALVGLFMIYDPRYAPALLLLYLVEPYLAGLLVIIRLVKVLR